jgi:hypothetical protein
LVGGVGGGAGDVALEDADKTVVGGLDDFLVTDAEKFSGFGVSKLVGIVVGNVVKTTAALVEVVFFFEGFADGAVRVPNFKVSAQLVIGREPRGKA